MTKTSNYQVIAKELVDDQEWRTVRINRYDVLEWIRQFDHNDLYMHKNTKSVLVDISERVYLLMKLTFPEYVN